MIEGLAVVLCAHGTRRGDGADEFRAVAAAVRTLLPQYDVGYAFLELSEPPLSVVLDDLAATGQKRIVVIPCMLFTAGHVKSDIPHVIEVFEARYPEVEVIYGRTFGIDCRLIEAASERIVSVLDDRVKRTESLLLLIGHGCSDIDVNGNLVKVMRQLWKSLGFGWGEIGFFGVTLPHMEVAIDHATRFGYRRIVVFPYLLFNGVLVSRLREALAKARRSHPDIEFVEAPYFSDHSNVIKIIADRAEEAATNYVLIPTPAEGDSLILVGAGPAI